MTLTDFILQRVAEDEAPTFEIVPDPRNPGYVGHACLICGTGPTFGGTVEAITEIAEEHAEQVHRRSRVLAECEAKRQMVADYLTFQRVSDERAEGTPLPQALTAAGIARGMWHALQILALPYADHEDYRQEWKP